MLYYVVCGYTDAVARNYWAVRLEPSVFEVRCANQVSEG
jgi:hypothetical protein